MAFGYNSCNTSHLTKCSSTEFPAVCVRVPQDELEKKYVGLVQSYGADLKTVQELFLQNRDNPPISWNLPPIAGALTWCRGLVDRIQIPMAKLQQLDRTILDREEAKEVAKVKYHILVGATPCTRPSETFTLIRSHAATLSTTANRHVCDGCCSILPAADVVMTKQCTGQTTGATLRLPPGVRHNHCEPSRVRKSKD